MGILSDLVSGRTTGIVEVWYLRYIGEGGVTVAPHPVPGQVNMCGRHKTDLAVRAIPRTVIGCNPT